MRHRVVEDGVAGGCVTPDGVVARPHPLQVQVHRHELELGLVLLHREAQGVTWKGVVLEYTHSVWFKWDRLSVCSSVCLLGLQRRLGQGGAKEFLYV